LFAANNWAVLEVPASRGEARVNPADSVVAYRIG